MKMYGINICLVFAIVCSGFLGATHQNALYWEARGDTAATKKNTASALVAWLRAEREAGILDRSRIIKKRVALQSFVKGASENNQIPFVFEMIKSIIFDIPLIFLQFLLLLSCFFAMLLLGRKGLVRFLDENLWVSLPLLVLSCALFIAKNHDETAVGVLLKPQAALTSGPSGSFPVVTSFKGPDVVSVIDTKDTYLKVVKNGFYGWVSREDLEIV